MSHAGAQPRDRGMRLSTRLTVAMVALVLLTAAAVGYLTERNTEAIALPRGLERIDNRAPVLAAGLKAEFRGARADVVGFGSAVAAEGIVRSRLAGGIDPIGGTTKTAWRTRMASRYRPSPSEILANVHGPYRRQNVTAT
jgi:hypothetical protein